MGFDKMFGGEPRWKQRLLRAKGRDAFGSTKHGRGKIKPKTYRATRKKRSKSAKMARRRNRSAR